MMLTSFVSNMLRRGCAGLALCLAMLAAGVVQAAEPPVVKVGGYEFAPYVEVGEGGKPQGLTLDLITLMNEVQDDYRFEFVITSPSRRYQDFKDGRYDMIMFENPAWGWRAQGIDVDVSEEFFQDGEVYIAQAQLGRDQTYFDSLFGKTTAGILGYHYGFAGFNADPNFLRAQWAMTLVNTNSASIELVLKGRVDVAVVTKTFLNRYLIQNPEAKEKLLISHKFDQRYSHRAMIRPGDNPGLSDIQALLTDLGVQGRLKALWLRAGVRQQ